MGGPVVLVVLDGYGIGDGGRFDATEHAHNPFLRDAGQSYPNASLETSGESVGLPAGQMGNSEVGHMTMGAGRVILQDLTRIGHALREQPVEERAPVRQLFEKLRASNGTLHLMGLVSDGGVHSHIEHLEELLRAARRQGIPACVHAFLDGRDTPPRSGRSHIERLMTTVNETGAHVATVSGRYYAMDRDSRWDRISKAYHAIVCREGEAAETAVEAVERAYARDESDEFVVPDLRRGRTRPAGRRRRLLLQLPRGPGAGDHERPHCGLPGPLRRRARAPRRRRPGRLPVHDRVRRGLRPAGRVSLRRSRGRCSASWCPPPVSPQLRIAETEKYAHVTFFFNSGVEEPFRGEDRILVPSPRDVDTYDHRPEMSALQVTQDPDDAHRRGRLRVRARQLREPGTWWGTPGVMDAAVKAVETIDTCLEKLAGLVLERDGQLLITADHGQLRADGRPRDRRAAHRPHHEPGAGPLDHSRSGRTHPARRKPRRPGADGPRAARASPAPDRDDGRSLLVPSS